VSESAGRRHVLARSGRVCARPGAFWASLGAWRSDVAVRLLAKGWHERDEESVQRLQDMLMHGGSDWREEWHGEGHDMLGMVMSLMISCRYLVSDAWLWSRGWRRVCVLT
jgi:hypothetical protein